MISFDETRKSEERTVRVCVRVWKFVLNAGPRVSRVVAQKLILPLGGVSQETSSFLSFQKNERIVDITRSSRKLANSMTRRFRVRRLLFSAFCR